MITANVSPIAAFRQAIWFSLLSLILLLPAAGLQAQSLTTIKDAIGAGGNQDKAPAESGAAGQDAPSDPAALERAISLLENDEARQALLADLKALQQGLDAQAQVSGTAEGVLTDLSARMERLSRTVSVEQVLNRWHLLLLNAGRDLRRLIDNPAGRQRLAREAGNFLVLVAIALLPGALAWLLLRYSVRRLRRENRPALASSLLCIPLLIPFAAALAALPLLGTETGTRLGVVFTYALLGGAGLYLLVALLISLKEKVRPRLARLLLPRVRPWVFGIGASLTLADAFDNTWISEPLAQTVPSLLSTGFYLLSALLCGLLALRHHRLATMLIRPRSHDDDPVIPFWFIAGRVAARSWQWAVIVVSAMAFLGILLLQGEEQAILRSSIVTALAVVATTLAASLAAGWIRLQARRLKAPPHRAYYLPRYLRIVRVLVGLIIWALGVELILLAWGSSLGNFFSIVIGTELSRALSSLLLIALVGWASWITLKSAIERALAGESANLQSQSARSRTLLPLLRSVGLVIIVLIGTITALSALGLNVTPLLAGAGVLGLAIGFGSQKLVQDLITGLFILFEDTISIGDYIDVAGHEGIVEGLSIRTVKMRDLDGTLHAVPFGQINSVRNLSKIYAYAMMNITVSYKEDVDEIIREFEAIGEELRKDPGLGWDILEPLEVFGLQKFTPDGMVVRVRFMTRPMRQWDVMRGFNLRVKRRFDELGIQMPVQQVMVHRSGAGPVGPGPQQNSSDQQEFQASSASPGA